MLVWTRWSVTVCACIAGAAVIVTGCSARVMYPETGLQRVVLPGLGDLKDDEIRAQFEKNIEVRPPVSAGVAWLSEAPRGMRSSWTDTPVSEYQRTGILNSAIDVLRQPPFSGVSVLPTETSAVGSGESTDVVQALRSAAARFQEDVAILMQTGVTQDSGFNFAALGFVGLVTIPLFPGLDLATGASAEMCSVDVRTGVMLACARGRGQATRHFVFPTNAGQIAEEMKEETLTQAAVAAAQGLRAAVAARLTEK